VSGFRCQKTLVKKFRDLGIQGLRDYTAECGKGIIKILTIEELRDIFLMR
jgi:hypothetical protein